LDPNDQGDFALQLSAQHAPIASNNFLFLAEQKWYDGTHF
jgi:cyclophilin family peptidyl-prolyl cis-trans isomerase